MPSSRWPNRISIYRPNAKSPPGGVKTYGGQDRGDMTLIAEGILANIQARNSGRSSPLKLPSDTQMADWRIYTPRGSLDALGIKNRDIVIDNLGRRFGITSDYNVHLGGNLFADRLEA